MNSTAGLGPRIEIAGVCGSGKSTLSQHILDAIDNSHLDPSLQFRRVEHLKYVLHSVPGLAQLLWPAVRARRLPDRTELKLLIYLMEWSRWLGTSGRHSGPTFLDQGPIYALARLGRTEPGVAGTRAHQRWWNDVAERWASSIDFVIWLDAPNSVLLERVNQRSQNHEIKGQPEEIGSVFIDRYRASYEEVLQGLGTYGGPEVIRCDTSNTSPDEVADRLKARLRLWNRSP